MWRATIFHAQSVHFPVALLITGSILWAVALPVKNGRGTFLENSGQLLVTLGTLAAWLAVLTGSLAEGDVARTICDPTVLKAHEQNAWVVAWVFSGATLLLGFLKFGKTTALPRKLFYALLLVLLITGTGFLVYTGSLGGKVVYQMGGGVYQPSADCNEFE